ncbi:MAG: hypothetical protein H8D23_33830 [Candidatus Brocadiales bacterium]|nr:hypothetical protein [Candidatus Brocadiales bacterium]
MRKIAGKIGVSKSSVQRHKKAIISRQCFPESEFWETEAGINWLMRMYVAVLLEFGINCGVGADQISRFFKRIRIDQHIGVSASSNRKRMQLIEKALIEYQRSHEEIAKNSGKEIEIVGSGDETFFGEIMMLVLMDLRSGYILLEETAEDRTYDTWQMKAKKRLNELGISVRHFVSDRAKALIKLAADGFGCHAGADLFHAKYDLTKWFGLALHRRLNKARTALSKSNQEQNALEPSQVKNEQPEYETYKQELQALENHQKTYKTIMQGISDAVHPFSTQSSTPLTGAQVEISLNTKADELENMAEKINILDSDAVLNSFRRQIESLSSHVYAWWLWVGESLVDKDANLDTQDWVRNSLLPTAYWLQHLDKCQNADQKKPYEILLKNAQTKLAAHPVTLKLTSSDREEWTCWAEWMATNFQRASSAVEGRNGRLSQLYHNGRGITSQRLSALTTLHNFDQQRRDGSSAAERLFDTKFPDVFEWLLEQMDVNDLPLPRRRNKRDQPPNPLIPLIVPS